MQRNSSVYVCARNKSVLDGTFQNSQGYTSIIGDTRDLDRGG